MSLNHAVLVLLKMVERLAMRPATGVMDGDGVKRLGSPTSDLTDPEVTGPGIPLSC